MPLVNMKPQFSELMLSLKQGLFIKRAVWLAKAKVIDSCYRRPYHTAALN